MRWMALAALAAVSAGCQLEDPTVSEVKERIVSRLYDPDSVEFRNIHKADLEGKVKVCGEVNARNRYGGYTGFQGFVFLRIPVEDTGRTIDKFWLEEDETEDYFLRVWRMHCAEIY